MPSGRCELALACDLIVAANDARFGLPEVKRGLVSASGGMFRLPRHIDMEWVLTGEPVTAERAHQVGLVNRLVVPGQALPEALALVRAVAANGPLAVRVTKQVLTHLGDWPVD